MSDTVPSPLLQYLIRLNLVEQESVFVGYLDAMDSTGDRVLRDFTIATAIVIMRMKGYNDQTYLRMLNHLKRLSDDTIRNGMVAIVNGAFMVLPCDGEDVRIVDLETFRDVEETPPALNSDVFSLASIWENAQSILQST